MASQGPAHLPVVIGVRVFQYIAPLLFKRLIRGALSCALQHDPHLFLGNESICVGVQSLRNGPHLGFPGCHYKAYKRVQIKPHDEGSKLSVDGKKMKLRRAKANGWQSTEEGNGADRKVGQGTGKSGYVALLCVVGWQRELVATLWPRVESLLCTKVAQNAGWPFHSNSLLLLKVRP